jgi:hypothetical protein
MKNYQIQKFSFLLLMAAFVTNVALSQNKKDSTDGRFHKDLFDRLEGTWKVSSVAHGFSSTGVITGKWILNHQFFQLHFKGNEIIPWWNMPMEYEEFIGYNHHKERYTVHGISIEGDADLSEGFCYGYRNGNEFKTIAKFSSDTSIIQRFLWEPATKTWNIKSTAEIGGKEGEVFLEMKLVALKPEGTK